MTNEEKLNSNTFFKSVAHHNLERFHSETIAWIFNTFPDTAKNFIKSIHEGITSVENIKLDKKCCWAELNQIDILLKYSYNSKNYQIIIENKMKASEHKIDAKKLLKGKHFDEYSVQLNEDEIKFLLNEEVKLSQTEYYYFREKMERAEQIVDFELKKDKQSFDANPNLVLKKYITDIEFSTSKKPNKKNSTEFLNKNFEKFNKNYCRYVYLKPSKINEEKFKNNNSDLKIDFDFKQLNTWNKQLSKNPWVTITYTQLINTIQKSGAIEKSEQALERYSKLKIEKKCIEDIIIANSYINFIQDNIKEEVNLDDFNENKEYARFDYFKLLFALVKANKISSKDQIDEYIEAGSSNGEMPLFAFYKNIELDEKYTFYYSNKKVVKNPKINVGIQIQGENFKYYVSSDDYDNTVINTSETANNYGDFVKLVLNEITKDWESKNEKIFATDKGFHPNKTKTFYSRSYKIKNFIVNDQQEKKRDIFDIANEILEKVNHFVNFDISTIIKNFK